ncbi:MAG TPA: hypothetical protein PLL06_23140 [Acidobacteriota bacterium]|nr:hypothetical protein [Acidobacteriota bacterium]HNG96389.1 hypothetical protein [Acidobacteriota bacterium]
MPHSFRTILKTGLLYFLLVFGVGFILGPIRILWLVPRLGERYAELIEMPLMLAAIILVARWMIRRFQIPTDTGVRLGMGFLAVVLLISVEFTMVLKLRALTLEQYFQSRDPISGTVYYLMLVVFALMPWILRRWEHRSAAQG